MATTPQNVPQVQEQQQNNNAITLGNPPLSLDLSCFELTGGDGLGGTIAPLTLVFSQPLQPLILSPAQPAEETKQQEEQQQAAGHNGNGINTTRRFRLLEVGKKGW